MIFLHQNLVLEDSARCFHGLRSPGSDNAKTARCLTPFFHPELDWYESPFFVTSKNAFREEVWEKECAKKKSSFSPSTVPQVLIEKRGRADWKRENEDGNQPMIEQTLRLIARITSSVQASFILHVFSGYKASNVVKRGWVLPIV